MTGKARVGFVSKYENGANVPTGQTQFHLRVGDFDFHTTDYQWLVIDGAQAYFEGTGTVNRDGNYGFMLTATDGQVDGGGGDDKFRIRIWDKDTGIVVYDNHLGGGDFDDPTTLLGGGSIVIHDGGDSLHATEGVPAGMAAATLTQANLAPVMEEAISYWAGQGVNADSLATLGQMDVHVADLSGVGSRHRLLVEPDLDRSRRRRLRLANGFDRRTWSDRRQHGFALGPSPHEFGHKLGLEHRDVRHVMAPTLAPRVHSLIEADSSNLSPCTSSWLAPRHGHVR